MSNHKVQEAIRETLLFDPDWYRQRYPDVAVLGMDPAYHYARYGTLMRRSPSEFFDARRYADVHALPDDSDPLSHFLTHYAVPQSHPLQLPVKDLVNKLWGGFSGPASERLEAAIDTHSLSSKERAAAAFVLARWHILQGDFETALQKINRLKKFDISMFRNKKCKLLAIECNIHLNQLNNAREMIDFVLNQRMDGDFTCALSNLLLCEEGRAEERLNCINTLYTQAGLLPMELADPDLGVVFGNWSFDLPGAAAVDGPLISVLVPVYNAAKYIDTAIGSLLAQTWRNLEIIAVDDRSSDDSWDKLQRMAAHDSRLKVFRNDVNVGAYGNRNNALARANGEFVTVHDSDDWSHPQMIEKQMEVLLARPDLKATCSRMARVDQNLRFTLRPQRENLEYIHRSYPSLLLRRSDLAKMREWDGVSANADDELLQRARTLWGPEAIEDVLPSVPMSFFLVHENSLTQQKGTSLNSLTFGIRHEYARQAAYWRKTRARGADPAKDTAAPEAALAYERRSMKDPFPIPTGLAPKNWEKNTAYDLVIVSDLSLLGGTRRCNEGYIAAARSMGLRVGLFHWPRFDLKRADVAESYTELSYNDDVDILVPEDTITAKLVLIHHPPILGYRIDAVPKITADRLGILVNQSPMQCWSQKPFYYDGGEASALCQALFGLDPIWIPISPRVRKILDRVGGFDQVLDSVWYPPFHGPLPDTPPAPPQGLGTGRPLVIGRHARDHWTKWPANADALAAAYGAGAPDIEVRLLGGAKSAVKKLDATPANWTVAEFDSIDVRTFLSGLDVFVHYVHEDYIEEFGRNAMEAMAAGRVVILPPEFESTFGKGAVYAAPQDMANTARALCADPAAYAAQVDRGLAFARNASGSRAVERRLGDLIG